MNKLLFSKNGMILQHKKLLNITKHVNKMEKESI